MPRAKKSSAGLPQESQAEISRRLADALEAVEHEQRLLRDVLTDIRSALADILQPGQTTRAAPLVHVTRMSKLGVPLDPPNPLAASEALQPRPQSRLPRQEKPASSPSLFGAEE